MIHDLKQNSLHMFYEQEMTLMEKHGVFLEQHNDY